MEFVVKATNPSGRSSTWISEPRPEGFRTLVERDAAAVFQTAQDAQVAITRLPGAFARAGVIFSIEPAQLTP
jgi:hypothetical protein